MHIYVSDRNEARFLKYPAVYYFFVLSLNVTKIPLCIYTCYTYCNFILFRLLTALKDFTAVSRKEMLFLLFLTFLLPSSTSISRDTLSDTSTALRNLFVKKLS